MEKQKNSIPRMPEKQTNKLLSPLPRWKSIFMSKRAREEARRIEDEQIAELKALLEMEKQEIITRHEQQLCEEILQNSADFSPQWDIKVLKDLQKEYNRVFDQEEYVKGELLSRVEKNSDKQWFISIVMPLLMVL